MLDFIDFNGGATSTYLRRVEAMLLESPYWRQHEGANFLLIISRAHPRSFMTVKETAPWKKMMVLTLEYHDAQCLAVPYPTFFHPSTDRDVDAWLAHVQRATRAGRRPEAVLLAGSSGRLAFRRPLVEACEEADACRHLMLKDSEVLYPEVAYIYFNHTFSIHPAGDTPTRRGFFDSLLAGCIPILFEDGPFSVRNEKQKSEKPVVAYTRFFSPDEDQGWIREVALLASSVEDAVSLASRVTPEQVAQLQASILAFIPRILYWDARAPLSSDMRVWRKYGGYNVAAEMLRRFAERQQRIRNHV
eukprot:scaffold718_cov252-Pinguiococcus_pyrenoidosus.AAC.10